MIMLMRRELSVLSFLRKAWLRGQDALRILYMFILDPLLKMEYAKVAHQEISLPASWDIY